MQRVSVEHNRVPHSHETDKEHKWGDNFTPIKQNRDTSSRHVACDYQPNCIIADNMLEYMTTKSSPSPLRIEMRTRSGQINYRPVRLGIGT